MGLKIKDINHRYWIPTCNTVEFDMSYKYAKKSISGKDHTEWKYFCMDGKLYSINKATFKRTFLMVTFTATEMAERHFPMIIFRYHDYVDHDYVDHNHKFPDFPILHDQ